ncbi:MAG: dihydrodipicolinate synthase family protein [Euryarchaeota archaeon]|nr:dihydrodipicolinate synthase family protein [Euryarchaeota archaeon]MDE1835091.1 dihydrodipicolinate synthase family protein [Euryarchaeota archaeon]MDE1879363.1 dihydrodipicolinate synthase family protein [Euryarchaeota archaeon]MDE2044946.1 dihydrodipicolinate synthase family protein [Thermoplasmata archaeon]
MRYTRKEAKSWAREKMVGQWTTMMTPFSTDGELDLRGLASNIERVLQLGTKGLGFSWNMGEFWSLTHEERLRLMEAVPPLVRGRALTAFQVTHTSEREVVALARRAQELGYDLAILAAPYIMTKTEEQVLDFVSRVANQVDLGLAFYNSPQFGIVLSAKALSTMADLPTLVAIKEASFNLSLSIDTHLQAGAKAVVSVPDEEIFFVGEPYGIHQQVMFANTSDWRFDTPSRHDYVRFIDLATRGDLEEARALYPRIWPVKRVSRKWWGKLAGRTGGALPVQMVKYWGELVGMVHGPVRPPVLPLTSAEMTELRSDLEPLGLLQGGQERSKGGRASYGPAIIAP